MNIEPYTPTTFYGLIVSVFSLIVSHIGLWIREMKKKNPVHQFETYMKEQSNCMGEIKDDLKSIIRGQVNFEKKTEIRLAKSEQGLKLIAKQVEQNSANIFEYLIKNKANNHNKAKG